MTPTPNSTSVIIVGGGASAVFAVVGLLERAAADGLPSPTITVIERGGTVGPGLAYGRADDHHLLNSPAGRMSLSPGDDTLFVTWCAARGIDISAGDYTARRLYGEYLAETFAALVAESGGAISSVQGEVVDVRTGDESAEVELADGTVLSADAAVLSIGNPPPSAWPAPTARVIDDPWAADALAGIEAADRVLLVGTGLTMIDVATTLARRHPSISLAATSRHLLVPRVHLLGPAAPGPGLDDGIATLGGLVSAFGSQVRAARDAGEPWQAVIDGIRPQLNPIWRRLSFADRRRYLSHVARIWDVHRHRMAPSVDSELSALFDSGRLTLVEQPEYSGYDVVINCTGPRSAATTGWNPVVDALVASGLVHDDPLGLGLDVHPEGAVLRADGNPNPRLFAIGPALRGVLWETTAIAEIRQEATWMAPHVLAAGVI